MKMQYSDYGLGLTKRFEGLKLVPYQDVAGVWTNGYGNTHNVVPGVAITLEQADADLRRNIQFAVDAVNKEVEIELSQSEFDAVVDLVYNIGTGAFHTSTLLRLLNSSDLHHAADEFARWDKAGGKHIAGLLRRRLAEQALFNRSNNV